MRVRDLIEVLWRLNHNAEGGYYLTILAGGEIRLMQGDVVVFASQIEESLVAEMEARTIPARVRIEFTRAEVEQLQGVINCRFAQLAEPQVVLDKLAAALQEGMPERRR